MKYLMLVAAGFIVTNALSSAQEPPTEWEVRNPFPIGDKLSSITFANDVFVVVDSSGAILTTSDGLSWTNRPIAPGLRDVTFGEGMYVAVGLAPNGRGRVFTSRNAVNWVPRTFMGGGMKAVAYGNGMFAAIGGHAIYLSQNGVQWQQVRSGINPTLHDIAFGNGKFVAVGSSSSSPAHAVAFRSRTGADWVRQTLNDQEPWTRVSFAVGSFYAASGSGQTFNSADGASWTYVDSYGARYAAAVVFGAGILETIGPYTDYYDTPTPAVSSVAYGNGRFIAVGPGGAIAMSLAGPRDDYNNRWRNLTGVSGSDLTHVKYGNGLYLAMSDRGMVMTSSDGANWTREWIGLAQGGNLSSSRITGLAYGNGMFVAVGISVQFIGGSTDGKHWSRNGRGTLGSDGFMDVAFGNGMFIAVGHNPSRTQGLVMVSNDGMTWTFAGNGIGPYGPFTRVDFDGTEFVVTRKDGTLLSTVDGQTWVQGGPAGWEWPARGFDTPHGYVNAWAYGDAGAVAVGKGCLILQAP